LFAEVAEEAGSTAVWTSVCIMGSEFGVYC